jgi:hypothetical protein
VPYKGSAPALTDLIGGQIDYTIETVAGTIGHVRSGRLKILGTSFARRTAATPDVPTLAEAADLPGYDIGAWIGYTAPPGTPREIVARLSGEIRKAMQAADLKERYLTLGLDVIASTPEEMGAFLQGQRERYAAVIKSANIKLEQSRWTYGASPARWAPRSWTSTSPRNSPAKPSPAFVAPSSSTRSSSFATRSCRRRNSWPLRTAWASPSSIHSSRASRASPR